MRKGTRAGDQQDGVPLHDGRYAKPPGTTFSARGQAIINSPVRVPLVVSGYHGPLTVGRVPESNHIRDLVAK